MKRRAPTRSRLRLLGPVALLAAVVGASQPSAAHAVQQVRAALVIGNNYGQPDETPLLYAERDAERMADVLVRLGGVPEHNLLLLRGANGPRLERVMADLAKRIRTKRAAGPVEVLLFVYYSGHASVGQLHLGSSQVTFTRLKKLVRTVGADVSVFVVDACRSGGMTRVKGAAAAAPFQIKVEDQLQSSGTAIIASSAAGEDAQESERLGGGIFTHHFINGLRGAADATSDQRVTIGEAYRYAYSQTLTSTSRTRFVQHPTYAFAIKGRQELTLTRTDQPHGQGRLHLVNPGFYIISEPSRGDLVVAELQARGGTDVVLPRGNYLVRRRGLRVVREATIAVREGQRADVHKAKMVPIPYGITVRRGLATRNVISVDAMTSAAQPLLAGQSGGLFGSLGATVETHGARLQLRLRYGVADAANADLQATQSMLGTDVGVFRIFDIPKLRLGVGAGLRLGGDWVMQRFETTGVAPDRDQWVWRVSPVLRVEYAPAARWTIGAECGLDVYAMQLERDKQAVWDNPVVPFCAAGISVYLP